MTQRILRRAGWSLIWTGAFVFAFLGYQLFITDLWNGRAQASARSDLAAELEQRRAELPEPIPVVVEAPPPDTTTTTPAPTAPAPVVTLTQEFPGEEGSVLGRLTIPSIGVDEVVFTGVGRDVLKMGPGYMLGTAMPGQPGNAVISGHRTTYGRPFYDLDLLEEGDLIEVETAIGVHVYEVRRILIVLPTDGWVAGPMDGGWLTLTTCHPRFSAAERLVVQAELVEGPNAAFVRTLPLEPELEENAT